MRYVNQIFVFEVMDANKTVEVFSFLKNDVVENIFFLFLDSLSDLILVVEYLVGDVGLGSATLTL